MKQRNSGKGFCRDAIAQGFSLRCREFEGAGKNFDVRRMSDKPHPDKPFIGRISRGFDFLGYAFTPVGLEVAPQEVERCVGRVSRLDERGVDLSHIGTYVRRWQRWVRSGLRALGEELSERALELSAAHSVASGGPTGRCRRSSRRWRNRP